MNIERMAVYRYRVPLKTPILLAGETVHDRTGFLLQLRSGEGIEGWGEAAPLPGFSSESLEDALQDLDCLQADLTGRAAAWRDVFPGRDLCPSVRFAVETALLELEAREKGTRPAHRINPEAPIVIPVNRLLSGATESMVEQIGEYAVPPACVKLKVSGGSVDEMAKRVNTVRALLPDTRLRLDANRAWTPHEASAFYELVQKAQIEYLEEPLCVPVELESFCRQTGCPVALDETLREVSPEGLGAYDFATAVVIKPTLVGGLSASLAWAEAAGGLGIRSVISASYECGVGTLALAQIAAALPGPSEPAGLDTYNSLAGDVLSEPLRLDGDQMNLPPPGQMPEIDLSQLERML